MHHYPNLRRFWYWASFLTPSGLVAVRDHDVPPPRTPGLEIRTDGLWAEFVCETPLEHWSGGLEAFGIRYDDPADAWGDEWGDRLAVGLDFEWELTGPPEEGVAGPGPPGQPEGGFVQPGAMWGEVLVGPSLRLPFSGPGLRARRWGVADWWAPPEAGDRTPAPPLDGQGRPVGEAVPLLVTGPDGRRARLVRTPPRGEPASGWSEWLFCP